MSEIQSEKKVKNTPAHNIDCTKELSDTNDNTPKYIEREVKQVITQVIGEFSGPIPPPSIMSGYEKCYLDLLIEF